MFRRGLALFSRTVWAGINLVEFRFKSIGAEIGMAGVESRAVVEGLDVIEDGGASLGVGREAAVIDQLVFEAAPERLDLLQLGIRLFEHAKRDVPVRGSQMLVVGGFE
jgi:hypothetical protein